MCTISNDCDPYIRWDIAKANPQGVFLKSPSPTMFMTEFIVSIFILFYLFHRRHLREPPDFDMPVTQNAKAVLSDRLYTQCSMNTIIPNRTLRKVPHLYIGRNSPNQQQGGNELALKRHFPVILYCTMPLLAHAFSVVSPRYLRVNSARSWVNMGDGFFKIRRYIRLRLIFYLLAVRNHLGTWTRPTLTRRSPIIAV